MRIRLGEMEDLPVLLAIYARARAFMAGQGNRRQWADKGWPPEQLIRGDIEAGKCRVCEQDGRVVAVFYYDYGRDIEPTYRQIEGAWLDDSPYGVVHRIATDGTVRGAGAWCLRWAFEQSGHLRIDTHPDNHVMQRVLERNHFVRCGTVHVEEDRDPRIAYERIMG